MTGAMIVVQTILPEGLTCQIIQVLSTAAMDKGSITQIQVSPENQGVHPFFFLS